MGQHVGASGNLHSISGTNDLLSTGCDIRCTSGGSNDIFCACCPHDFIYELCNTRSTSYICGSHHVCSTSCAGSDDIHRASSPSPSPNVHDSTSSSTNNLRIAVDVQCCSCSSCDVRCTSNVAIRHA